MRRLVNRKFIFNFKTGGQMANINTITVEIKTGSREKSTRWNVHGLVYLGIGGRDFDLIIDGQEFKNGSTNTFILGEGTNTGADPRNNDPRSPFQLVTETLSKYPIYIRFEPRREDERWEIDEINVVVNPGAEEIKYSTLGGGQHIVLSDRSTKVLYFGA